jgi:hypothetical protein
MVSHNTKTIVNQPTRKMEINLRFKLVILSTIAVMTFYLLEISGYSNFVLNNKLLNVSFIIICLVNHWILLKEIINYIESKKKDNKRKDN